MSHLASLQNQFQDYLLNNQLAIKKSIAHTKQVPASKRLAIYFDAYRSRLIDALVNNFPLCLAQLGLSAFSELASDYIDKSPSSYRSIRWYGDSFALYLKENSEPYLAELAEFEWKMTLTFDAADEAILSIEQIAAIPAEAWPSLSFIPHASLQLMNFSWNSVEIWEALSQEQAPPKPLKQDKALSWALWRRAYINRFYAQAPDEAWALQALSQGSNFGDLCEGLCNWMDEQEVGLRAASLLKGWIQSGMIAKAV